MSTKMAYGVMVRTIDIGGSVRFGRGVKWRAYEDGIVVYVPATCETHILEPQFAAFFRSIASRPFEVENSNPMGEDTFDAVDEPGDAGSLVQELVSLKIIDVVN